MDEKKVCLSQQTNYPWDGDITINIDQNAAGQFSMKIRIPGWVKNQVVPSDLYQYSDGKQPNYTISVNGQAVNKPLEEDGYFTISRKWKKGDKVQIHFDMEPRTIRANKKVEADRGMIAIERGPLVYCAEHPDNSFDITEVLMNQKPKFNLNKKVIGGASIIALITDAQSLNYDEQGKLTTKNQRITLIPYYAWCQRGSGKMRVWLPQDIILTKK